MRAVARIPATFLSGEGDVAVEEKDLDFLRAVREELQFDLGIGARDPLQDGAGQIGIELLERLHRVESDPAQLADQLRMLLRLVERAVSAKLCLDLVVAR